MNHVFFPTKGNYGTFQKSYVHAVWFLENQIVKNWTDVVLHHMLDIKRKSITLPYAELIIKILSYTGYEFGEEEPEFVHTKIGLAVISKMGFSIQEGELVLQMQIKEI